MALKKRGRIWHAYYTSAEGRRVWRTTGTGDRRLAERIESRLMRLERIRRAARGLEEASPGITAALVTPPTPARRNRVRLSDMFAMAQQHRQLSVRHGNTMKILQRETGLTYADQVTPQVALAFLDRCFGDKSAKTYNNVKTYLNTIFKLCSVRTGADSPFSGIPNRLNRGVRHHAVIRDAEYREILGHADAFWRFMTILSYNTGMPKEVCLRFCPEMTEVDGNGVTWAKYLRSKTARFGRQCQVPLNAAVMDAIAALPVAGDARTPYCRRTGVEKGVKQLKNEYGELLRGLSFYDAGAAEMLDFHSLRASFITRCRESGMADHAIRSMVGHVSEATTDVYSHDMVSPLQVLSLGGPVGGQ